MFALVFLVITFAYELHDATRALPFSLTTVVLLAVEAGLWVLRRKLLRRTDDDS